MRRYLVSTGWGHHKIEKLLEVYYKIMKPPQPKKIPKIHIAHGDERIDNYYWLRDDTRKDPEIISYLEEENQYLEDWFGKK